MPYRETIAAAYDAGVEAEYRRLTETPLQEAEYKLITGLLDEYIRDGSTVIDVGSGPGRYAEHLMLRGCKVGLIDLSAKSLKAFSDRIEDEFCKDNILFNRVSCATQLNWVEGNSADAILIMGPLYHLISEEHRNIALAHCNRILKPGGFLFSIFLSPFPVLNQFSYCKTDGTGNNGNLNFSDTCNITHTSFQGYKVPQFRCWPCTARDILKSNNFDIIRINDIEGAITFISEIELMEFNKPEKKADLLNNLRMKSEIDSESGITHQFVVVGRKGV
jgi:ubiquinone/menaquinone biosynthesis C-methylase UbiE